MKGFGIHAMVWSTKWDHEGAERAIAGAAGCGQDYIEIPLIDIATVDAQHSRALLEKHQIYVQAINYPTVPVGQERLRITPTPGHHKVFRDHLVEALESVWQELDIKRTSDWEREGGFIGVGVKDADPVAPLWTDAQLGLTDVVEGMKSGMGALGVLENVLAREQEEVRQVQAVAAAA